MQATWSASTPPILLYEITLTLTIHEATQKGGSLPWSLMPNA